MSKKGFDDVSFKVGQQIEYFNCHDVEKTWRKGTINGLATYRRGFVVFYVKDLYTSTVLPVNKNIIREVNGNGRHKKSGKKSYTKKVKKR